MNSKNRDRSSYPSIMRELSTSERFNNSLTFHSTSSLHVYLIKSPLFALFRTQIKLESLEDAVVLDNPAEDSLQGN